MPFNAQLSAGFDPVDNQFGSTAPCGPNDPTPAYPCNSPGAINQNVGLGMPTSNGMSMLAQTLGAPGAPFQRYTSSMSGANRTHHIEYGFDMTLPGFDDTNEQTLRIFFVVDSTTDANGALVGNASGTFNMLIDDGYLSRCHVTSGDPSSSGTFTAGPVGLITCLNNDGSNCPSTVFFPNMFTTPNSGGGEPFENCDMVP